MPDIEWAKIVKNLGRGGIVLVAGLLMFLVRPETTVFNLKGTEMGVITIAVGVLGFLLGTWKFKH